MTARDINNKIIREADWIKYHNRIYQIHTIHKNELVLWFRYKKINSKVFCMHKAKLVNSNLVCKIDPPTAYNVTDNE